MIGVVSWKRYLYKEKYMKIQFDFEQKTIKLEGDVNFGKLIKQLDKMKVPYKEFTLETNSVINNWTYPIIYPQPYWNNPDWWCNSYYNGTFAIDCQSHTTTNAKIANTTSIYNVEV